MSSFPHQPLGNILGDKGYIRGPFGSALVRKELQSTGIPVYEQQHAITGTREFRFYVSPEKYDELKRFAVKRNDLIISCSGTVGRVSTIGNSDPLGIISQALLILRPDVSKVLPRFLRYFLESHVGKQELVQASHGTVQVNIAPRAVVENIPVPVPSIDEQRTIAYILGTLDDKIELNRRMNETLEAMAQAIFKSWFVDFDPVRAKATGEPPESICRRLGLTPALLTQFPDGFQDSELGEIPEGWAVSTLGEQIVIHDSKRIPLSNREREERQGPYPYYGAAALMDQVDAFLFDGPHILMGEDGSVTNADGTPVMQYVWGKFWVNNHAHVLTAKAPMTNEHLLLLIRPLNIAPFVTGAVQAKLSQGNLRRIPVIAAPEQLNSAFGAVISPLFEGIRELAEQTKTLCETRDVLLPKLLAGELAIDAESAI